MSALLRKGEKRVLGMEAAKAWKFQKDLDLIELDELPGNSDSAKAKAWRHQITKREVGIESFCDLEHRHFRTVLAAFLALQGRDLESFDLAMNTGKPVGAKSEADTIEARECALALLVADLDEHREWYDEGTKAGEHRKWIHTGYVTAVARNKFKKPGISYDGITTSLSAGQIKQLHFTIRNRIAAAEGRGKPQNRNTSQRRRNRHSR